MEILEEGRFIGGYSIAVECLDSVMAEMLGCTPLHDSDRLDPSLFTVLFRRFRHPRKNTDDHLFSHTLASGAVIRPSKTDDCTFTISYTGEESESYLKANAGFQELRFLYSLNKARVALNRQYALLGYVVKPELEVSINMTKAVKKAPGQV